MGGLGRCVACGEVHWNLSFSARADSVQACRLCGAELKAEKRRPGRRFERLLPDPHEAVRPGGTAGFGSTSAS